MYVKRSIEVVTVQRASCNDLPDDAVVRVVFVRSDDNVYNSAGDAMDIYKLLKSRLPGATMRALRSLFRENS